MMRAQDPGKSPVVIINIQWANILTDALDIKKSLQSQKESSTLFMHVIIELYSE